MQHILCEHKSIVCYHQMCRLVISLELDHSKQYVALMAIEKTINASTMKNSAPGAINGILRYRYFLDDAIIVG